MRKDFLNIDEVLKILNINSKNYLSKYLKKNGIKVLKGKAKPYPKDEILRLAKKRQDENHYNSKQNKVILYFDENYIKEKPRINKTEQTEECNFKPLNLETIEQELTQKIIKALENLGIYDPLEDNIIKVYTKNLIFLECTSNELEKKGFTTNTDKGTPIITPELAAFNSLTKNVIGLAKILGIGSPNRVRLKPKEKKEENSLDIIIEEDKD